MKQRMMTIRIGRMREMGPLRKGGAFSRGEEGERNEWMSGRAGRSRVEFLPTREELRRERRWRIMENVVNVLLGVAGAAGLFWCGWLVGSGVVGF